MADPVPLIQATLAPVFLISGAAIFLNFAQARLFRVVDRLRTMPERLDEVDSSDRRKSLKYQRDHAIRRAVLLRNAVVFGVLVIAFTVLTTLLILVQGVFAGVVTGAGAVVAFALALLCFAMALILVTADAYLSVRTAQQAARDEVGERVPEG